MVPIAMPGLIIENAIDVESQTARQALRAGEIEWHSNLIRQFGRHPSERRERKAIVELICDNIDGMDDLILRALEGADANAIADQVKDMVDDAIKAIAITRLPASLQDE
jgi:hypothetical protein